jgi:hypothetical protein
MSGRVRCSASWLDYSLLFRWFVGLGVDDPVWVPTVFTKNRDRLLDADVAAKFMAAVLAHREVKPLLSNDHFSVDGTLVEAWASLKSFRAKDGSDEPPGPGRNGEREFHGEKRANDTHESTTDPDAKLYRKSSNTAAKLCFIGHEEPRATMTPELALRPSGHSMQACYPGPVSRQALRLARQRPVALPGRSSASLAIAVNHRTGARQTDSAPGSTANTVLSKPLR